MAAFKYFMEKSQKIIPTLYVALSVRYTVYFVVQIHNYNGVM
jgi:hypothetical protein